MPIPTAIYNDYNSYLRSIMRNSLYSTYNRLLDDMNPSKPKLRKPKKQISRKQLEAALVLDGYSEENLAKVMHNVALVQDLKPEESITVARDLKSDDIGKVVRLPNGDCGRITDVRPFGRERREMVLIVNGRIVEPLELDDLIIMRDHRG